MPPEITRRSLLAFFGSAAAALAVAKTLPAPIREQVELALRDIDPPPGMSYQWNLPEMITQASQWIKVPDERHGGSEIGGLILCERPIEITLASRQRDIDKALAQARNVLGVDMSATVGTYTESDEVYHTQHRIFDGDPRYTRVSPPKQA
jgi:hypothetical protein